MGKKIFDGFMGQPKRPSWQLLECSSGLVHDLRPHPAPGVPLGTGIPWRLRYRSKDLILERTVDHYVPVVVNAHEYGDEDHYGVEDSDYALVAKDSYNVPAAWILFRTRRPGAYTVLPGGDPSLLHGPFQTWDDLLQFIGRTNLPDDATVSIEGTRASFNLGHLLGRFGAGATPPPLPPPLPPIDEGAKPPPLPKKDAGPPFIPIRKAESGNLVCLYCRCRFEDGDYYYFPEHPDLAGHPPAFPADWNTLGLPLDAKGSVCKHRACPRCGGRLPKSFGPETDYTIISLVGQSHTGKSYFIGTMGRRLGPALSRSGIGLLDDDAELNIPFRKMCTIPFHPGKLDENGRDMEPWRRYIDKTDDTQDTQTQIYHEEDPNGWLKVPKPFILRLTDQRTRGVKRLVLYDNSGEDYTQFGRENVRSKKSAIASGHLGQAAVIMVLYDPTVDPQFCFRLRIAPKLVDEQLSMLKNMQDCMEEELGRPDVPIAILVGKSDVWRNELAPDLSDDFYTEDGHLNLATVQRNSDILKHLLEYEMSTGIPGAASSISRNVCFFPVTALGSPPIECFHPDLGTNVHAPQAPAEPWGVEIPILWGLWKAGLIGDGDAQDQS